MPLLIACPGCGAKYQVIDSQYGKTLRCQKCGKLYAAPKGAPTPVIPVVLPVVKAPAASPYPEVLPMDDAPMVLQPAAPMQMGIVGGPQPPRRLSPAAPALPPRPSPSALPTATRPWYASKGVLIGGVAAGSFLLVLGLGYLLVRLMSSPDTNAPSTVAAAPNGQQKSDDRPKDRVNPNEKPGDKPPAEEKPAVAPGPNETPPAEKLPAEKLPENPPFEKPLGEKPPVKDPPVLPVAPNPPKEQGEIAITQLGLNGLEALPCVCWAKDGKAFYVLGKNGTLLRINAATVTETGRLDVGAQCTWLSLSAEGLVVSVSGKQEVWLVDLQNLQPSKKIAVPSVKRAVSAPGLSVAFASGGGGFNDQVSALDLKAGQIVKQFGKEFRHAQITPDGKYLFVQEGIEQLVRYNIVNTDLLQEEKSERIAQNGQQICVSPDSKFVSLPSGGGNYGAANYSTFVYRINNLKQPAMTISSGAYPQTMGFDPKQNLIYAQNFDVPLLVYNLKGLKLKECKLGTSKGADVRQFAVHPEGGKVVVVAGKQVFLADTSKVQGGNPDEIAVIKPGAAIDLFVQPLGKPGLNAAALSGDGLSPQNMLPCICWAGDSQSFYTLEKTGTLRRISANGTKQLAKLDLGAACSWLSLSAEGLVVTLAGASEAWLISDDLQKVRDKIRLPDSGMKAISAPTLSVALAGKDTSYGGKSVVLIDLKMGAITKEFAKMAFRHAALSPDGKHFFAENWEELHSYQFTGTDLILTGKSDRIAQNGQCIVVSPDSRFVALPSGGGNYQLNSLPKPGPYSTYVYSVGDLKNPKIAIKSGAYPRALGFDSAGKWIYAMNHDTQFILFDSNGIKHQEFKLAPPGIHAEVKQFAAQPQGGKVVILSGNQLTLVDMGMGN